MKIYELNAGTITPDNCERAWGAPHYVCRCLLIETDTGLVAVDTGIGLKDIADPTRRLGDDWIKLAQPSLDPLETLHHQVKALGYKPSQLRDIVLTHHHRDHVGGLADFPAARIHALPEVREAVRRLPESDPQRASQWEHKPVWAPTPSPDQAWRGLATYSMDGVSPAIRLVPLPGHAPGHAGVLVRQPDDRWIFHVGDAAFHPSQHSSQPVPPGPAAFAEMTQDNAGSRVDTEKILTRLHASPGVRILTAHGPVPQ